MGSVARSESGGVSGVSEGGVGVMVVTEEGVWMGGGDDTQPGSSAVGDERVGMREEQAAGVRGDV